MTDAEWNHLSTRMASFHNHFRSEFKQIYTLSSTFSKRGLSLPRFIDYALQFNEQLTFHHTIEERMVFPALAQRMPEFAAAHEHTASHVKIHDGLERYTTYLDAAKRAPEKYKADELKEIMDALASVLFPHLEDEERSLKKENMQKYWTLEELKRLPM